MPYNLALHEHLLSLGYTYQQVEADWEDVGTGETGPMVYGHHGYDEYTGPDEYCFASADGVLDRQPRDLELEKWLDQHAPSNDQYAY